MTHFLFPNGNPPALQMPCPIPQACTWLIAVMDDTDPGKRFVVSLYNFFLERGYLTENQLDALRKVAGKTFKRFMAGDLEAQGAVPAISQSVDLGNVIPLRQVEDGAVLE